MSPAYGLATTTQRMCLRGEAESMARKISEDAGVRAHRGEQGVDLIGHAQSDVVGNAVEGSPAGKIALVGECGSKCSVLSSTGNDFEGDEVAVTHFKAVVEDARAAQPAQDVVAGEFCAIRPLLWVVGIVTNGGDGSHAIASSISSSVRFSGEPLSSKCWLHSSRLASI